MVKLNIKHVDVLSSGRILGLFSAMLGLFISIIALFFGALLSMAGLPFSAAGSLLIVIIWPIIWGLLGFSFGCFYAVLYNLSVKADMGIGIEVDVDEINQIVNK